MCEKNMTHNTWQVTHAKWQKWWGCQKLIRLLSALRANGGWEDLNPQCWAYSTTDYWIIIIESCNNKNALPTSPCCQDSYFVAQKSDKYQLWRHNLVYQVRQIKKIVSLDRDLSQNFSYFEKIMIILPILNVHSDIVRKIRICLTPPPSLHCERKSKMG